MSAFPAAFGAVYVALYARFSSQWNYLANLYNQIMQCRVKANGQYDKERLARWCAGFVEDAWRLHLLRKPMFTEVVSGLLQKGFVSSLVGTSLGNTEYLELTEAVREWREHREP